MNSTNETLQKVIEELKSKNSKLCDRLASDLCRSSRIRREVNLSRLNRFTKENEIIVVPGKVLGGGEMSHKITISAFNFSSSAISKLEKNGSKIIPLDSLIKEPLENKRIRIMG